MSKLLKSQANAVLNAVQSVGFAPSAFEWTQRSSSVRSSLENMSCLVHRPSGFYFLFDITARDTHYCSFSPGLDREFEERHPGDWDGQLQCVSDWLRYVKREVEAPDLWSVLGQQADAMLGDLPAALDSNEQFSPDEVGRIAEALREVKSYMAATYELTSDQTVDLSDRLDYLESAASRLGRKDWINLAFGVLTNLAIAAAFNPDAARGLLHIAAQALRWVVSNALPPGFP